MSDRPRSVTPAPSSSSADIDAFLDRARPPAVGGSGRGRLIFAMDATMSRQPTWDLAMQLQGRMFTETEALGGLDVQLVYFRGLSECRASRFISGGAGLAKVMARIRVESGNTQVGRVLAHAVDEGRQARVGALVYVGDSLEERPDPLYATAGKLALLGVKAFMFHEGGDPWAARGFREIARLTGGAYAAFDTGAPGRLAALLGAAAVYAAGGQAALARHSAEGSAAQNLLSQLRQA